MSGIFDQVINYAPPSLLKGTVTYKGAWSAATNTPTLINPPDSTTNGFYYVVSAAGTQFSLSFNIGDWIISNGSAWEKVDNTDAVSSVFGRTGAVVGVSTDYSSVGITATAVGASSPSTGAFTTLSATTPLAVASGGTGVASSTGTTNVVLSGSPTITTPVIAQINDANGNETLKLASIASAVNEVTIENAATGNAVHILATGGDASVGLHLAGKGASGYVNVQDSVDATKRIMFNASGGTTNTRTMLSSTQTVDRTLSLPDATDTLVGIAATQTLTNKTLTSPTITGGALNGTLGATTPSTIAGTTGTFSGAVAINNASLKIGTNSGYTYFVNDQMNFGFSENSAYAGVINYTGYNGGTTQFRNLDIYDGKSTRIAQFTSTGLNATAIGATTPSTGAFTTGIINLSSGSDQQETLSVRGNSGVGMLFRPTFSAGTQNNWRVAASIAAGNAFEITPSTALGGTTFTTPVATFTPSGAAITGTLSATGAVTLGSQGTGTNTLQLILDGGSGTGGGAQLYFRRNGTTYCQFGNQGAYENSSSTNTVLAVTTGTSFRTLVNNSEVTAVSSTGLAVTGTLSASGSFTASNASKNESGNYIIGGLLGGATYLDSANSGDIYIRPNGTQVGQFSTTGLAVTGALSCTGALSKGSGSFRIEHPLPSKSATHQLVHSFIEGPKCDLIYRGKVDLVNGKASVNIDADSTMTEGTFEALCATVQCFTSNESGWGAIRGKVVGNILTIEAQDSASTDNVSWMVIGERKDPHIMDTDWTDKNGRPIVEPLKPAEPALESK